jgi:putative effector of murein hydrolase LrgA (UPF0299 family)
MKAFDITPIVNDFYDSIFEDERRSNWEGYSLLFIPAGVALLGFVRQIDGSFISTMSTTLAILFGFTFTSLLTTARYVPTGNQVEKEVVDEARIGTSYALLVNLFSLILIVFISILVVNYQNLSYGFGVIISTAVYYSLFHYLTVMVYLMRYLYLLATGGAFEQPKNEEDPDSQEQSDDDLTLIQQ